MALHVERVGRRGAPRRPTSAARSEHVVGRRHEHAVADDAVLRGRETGGDRRERGRGRRRHHGRDRTALPSRRASGMRDACARNAFQPRPSSTSSTTLSASRAIGGIQSASARAEQRRDDSRDGRAVVAPVRIGSDVGQRRATPMPRGSREHGGMKVSTRGDYAARALLSLALHGSDRPTSVKEIAERTHLPAAVPRADPARR